MLKTIKALLTLLLISNSVFSQKTGKAWFLLDSIDETKLSFQDKYLLDSVLPRYHQSKIDTVQIRELMFLSNALGDEALWIKYNNMVYQRALKGGNDKTYLYYKSSALSNIAYELSTIKGDNKSALKIFEQNLELQKRLCDTAGITATLNNIATIYLKSGNIKKAIDLQLLTLKYRELSRDKLGIGVSLMHLGEIYKKQGDIVRALNYFCTSLKIFEGAGEQKDISTVLINLGQIYSSQNDFVKSSECYNKARLLLNLIGEKQASARVINYLGKNYEMQNDFKKALENYNLAKKMYESIGDPNGIGISFLYIGNLYEIRKKYDSAMHYLVKAEKILKQIGNKQDLVSTYNVMSGIYYKKKNYEKSRIISQKSLDISIEFGFPIMIKEPAKQLYQLYKLQNKPTEALKMYELYIVMTDSLNRIENKKAIIREQFKNEYEKRAAADSLQQAERLKYEQKKHEAEIAKQNIFVYSAIFCFVLTLAIALVSYRAYRIKKHSTKQILFQKQIIELKQKEILASIHYARRIQTAILPSQKYIDRNLSELQSKASELVKVA